MSADIESDSLELSKPVYYYGISEDNDIQARNIEYRNDGTSFDVFIEEEYYGHFDLPLFGKHMLLNALAAIGVCHYERMDAKEVSKGYECGIMLENHNDIKVGDVFETYKEITKTKIL